MPKKGETSARSQKLRTEAKLFIDRLVVDGIPVTKACVERGMGVSHSFVNTKEISDYIKAAQEKQKEQDLRVDVDLQNTILYRKLMASCIFQYALLDEQEAFYKEAIKYLREKKQEDN